MFFMNKRPGFDQFKINNNGASAKSVACTGEDEMNGSCQRLQNLLTSACDL
jgi:hypothetical protein